MKHFSSFSNRRFSARQVKWLLNFWPAWWFSGIRVQQISADFRSAAVTMRLTWYNRNFVGTQFGGNLYAMTDPFFMLLLLHHLSKEYYVWDQAARIRFVRPGKEAVQAEFNLADHDLQQIKQRAAAGEKTIYTFLTEVKSTSGEVVAIVEKDIYVRLKQH